MLRIVHCVFDQKFIDGVVECTQQNWDNCHHEYLIVSKEQPLTFIKHKEYIKFVRDCNFLDYIKKNNIDAIVLHAFHALPSYIIRKIPSSKVVVWFSWGYDIYSPLFRNIPPLIPVKLMHSETLKLFAPTGNNTSLLSKVWLKLIENKAFSSPKGTINFVKKSIRYVQNSISIKKAVSRVDLYSGVIPTEYELIKSNPQNKFFKAKPVRFNYLSDEFHFEEENINEPTVQDYNIQLGNSATGENNHLDIIKQLSKYNLNDKKIYSPLSYGEENYADIVIGKAKEVFSDKFIPLRGFLPFKEYSSILNSVRYAIFFVERQQAMGNIFMAIWRGSLVFLSKSNPAYKYLKSQGYIIFTVQDDLEKIERNEILSDEQIKQNRRLLIKDYSFKADRERAVNIISSIKSVLERR